MELEYEHQNFHVPVCLYIYGGRGGPSAGPSKHPRGAGSKVQKFKRVTSPSPAVPVVDDGEVSPGAEAHGRPGDADREDLSGLDGPLEGAERRLRSRAK